MCISGRRAGASTADSVSYNGVSDVTEKKGQLLVNLGVKSGLGCVELTDGGRAPWEPDPLQIALNADCVYIHARSSEQEVLTQMHLKSR